MFNSTDASSLCAEECIPPKVPNTEDFLLYLCLKCELVIYNVYS